MGPYVLSIYYIRIGMGSYAHDIAKKERDAAWNDQGHELSIPARQAKTNTVHYLRYITQGVAQQQRKVAM
jgi:hypothetical protein